MITEPGKVSRFDDSMDEAADDPRILELVKEYQEEWEKRGRPSRERYIHRHPELAEYIIDYLDGVDLLQQNAKALSRVDQNPLPLDPGLSKGDRLGEFELIREVGRGGMGIVYEAHQTSLNRRVAIKVLPAAFALDRARIQRFTVEAQAAAAVVHPHIVPVYAIGEDRGVPYYVMRLIDGTALDLLANRVSSRTALPNQDTTLPQVNAPNGSRNARAQVNNSHFLHRESMTDQLLELSHTNNSAYFNAIACLGSQVARALDHAHQCGVVHRDVKPANLMLDRDGHIWVTDFGLALFADSPSVSRTGSAMGTLRYMSPEQAAGDRRRLDHRTDVYSLAITLYELLLGRPAFSAESPPALLHQIATLDPPKPRSIDRDIPRDLETILLKAMQKDAGERYTTAAEFADELDRFLEEKPIAARRPWAWDRAMKWTSRHPGTVTAMLASLLVAIVASGVAMGLVSSEQRETERALEAKERALKEMELAKEAAVTAKNKEKERADEVQQQLDKTKRLGDLVFQISEEEIGSVANFQGPRKKLLLTALGIYSELEKVSIGQDPYVLERRAKLEDLLKRVKTVLEAQDFKRETDTAFLLFHNEVKNELALTDEQIRKVDANQAPRPGTSGGGFPVRGTGRPPNAPNLSDEAKIDLIMSLSAMQRQRLRQIYVQFRGPKAFTEPDVIEYLELTPKQRQDIDSELKAGGNGVQHWEKSKFFFMRPKLPDGVDPTVKVMEAIMQILIPVQKQKWLELVGPTFYRTQR